TLFRFGDLDGNHLEDLIVLHRSHASIFPNLGASLAKPITFESAPTPSSRSSRFSVGRVTGAGLAELVWIDAQGQVSVANYANDNDLLEVISNGYGATTSITYEKFWDARLWEPVPNEPTKKVYRNVDLVRTITSNDNLDLAGGANHAFRRTFDYENPYFAPEDDRFVGFRTIKMTSHGDATRPTEVTSVDFHVGACADDPGTLVKECVAPQDLGNPNASLANRPARVSRADAEGLIHEVTDFKYEVRRLYKLSPDEHGVPERGVTRHGTLARVDVTRFAVPYFGNPYASDVAVLSKTWSVDDFGNITSATDLGRAGKDVPVRRVVEWERHADDKTGWTFRATHGFSTSTLDGVVTDATQETYVDSDKSGKPLKVEIEIKGTQALDRFHEGIPGETRPEPPAPPSASK
ncbi:hypothetical protein EON77_14275, partial [bacterium]